MNEININDKVRSFDFDSRDLEGEAACFVEGIVTDLTHFAGCDCYDIQVTRRVFGGEEVEVEAGEQALPPINGKRTTMGRIADGVVKIEGRASMNENEKHQLIAAAWINIKNHQGDSDPKHLENAEQYLKEVIDHYLAESKKIGEQA